MSNQDQAALAETVVVTKLDNSHEDLWSIVTDKWTIRCVEDAAELLRKSGVPEVVDDDDVASFEDAFVKLGKRRSV